MHNANHIIEFDDNIYFINYTDRATSVYRASDGLFYSTMFELDELNDIYFIHGSPYGSGRFIMSLDQVTNYTYVNMTVFRGCIYIETNEGVVFLNDRLAEVSEADC